jgi:hypothetical protein
MAKKKKKKKEEKELDMIYDKSSSSKTELALVLSDISSSFHSAKGSSP